MNKLTISVILVTIISGTMTGCASITSQSGSEKVTITSGPIATYCKYKGKVSLTSDLSGMSHHSHYYDELKNQAMNLGANTILLSSSSGMTDKKHWMAKTLHSEKAVHNYSGVAYWCPVR